MIAYFILGVGLLVGGLLLIKWFTEADPRKVGVALLWTLGGIGLVFGLTLLWLGRYQLAWMALPALMALGSRWRQIASAFRRARSSGQGQQQGRSSTVETRFLRMTLMHETGVMTGEIRDGAFAGRRLEDLTLQDCVALWREVQAADTQSATVLEAYMDRVHGADWRRADTAGAESAAGPRTNGAMTAEEARAVLGVDAGADAATIQAAYRRLMKQVHPDHGGSDYFAMKLNEARRVLLGE